jgi:hypothetical protein
MEAGSIVTDEPVRAQAREGLLAGAASVASIAVAVAAFAASFGILPRRS